MNLMSEGQEYTPPEEASFRSDAGQTDSSYSPASSQEQQRQYWDSERERIIKEVPSNTEGIDVERIDRFFKKLGLEPKQYVLLDEEGISKLKDHFQDNPAVKRYLEGGADGIYLQELDLVLAKRIDLLYQREGRDSVAMESFLVHEEAHSTGSHQELPYVERTVEDQAYAMIPRMGQVVINMKVEAEGNFLEEGFAETIRLHYLAEETERGTGLADLPYDYATFQLENPDRQIAIATKYADSKEEGQPNFAVAAFAGQGTELLIRRDPALFDAMIKARTSVEGLREVAQRINNISPGLYSDLRRREYNTFFGYEFAAGLASVIEKVYGNDVNQVTEGKLAVELS
jgi:hypothetical protein